MANGYFVYGGGWYHERIFLPVPGSDSLLYLISCCVTSSCPYGLYYTLIDLKANNDSGAVIQKNVPLNSYPAFDALMAVQHGNGRDWWVISQKWDGGSFNIPNNEFNLYLVTSNGISLHSQQYVGSSHVTNAGHLDQGILTHRGKAFALDGAEIPAAAFDIAEIDGVTEEILLRDLHRRVAAAMENEGWITAQQAAGIDSLTEQVGSESGGFCIVPKALHEGKREAHRSVVQWLLQGRFPHGPAPNHTLIAWPL